jgi:hypothetical protein
MKWLKQWRSNRRKRERKSWRILKNQARNIEEENQELKFKIKSTKTQILEFEIKEIKTEVSPKDNVKKLKEAKKIKTK